MIRPSSLSPSSKARRSASPAPVWIGRLEWFKSRNGPRAARSRWDHAAWPSRSAPAPRHRPPRFGRTKSTPVSRGRPRSLIEEQDQVARILCAGLGFSLSTEGRPAALRIERSGPIPRLAVRGFVAAWIETDQIHYDAQGRDGLHSGPRSTGFSGNSHGEGRGDLVKSMWNRAGLPLQSEIVCSPASSALFRQAEEFSTAEPDMSKLYTEASTCPRTRTARPDAQALRAAAPARSLSGLPCSMAAISAASDTPDSRSCRATVPAEPVWIVDFEQDLGTGTAWRSASIGGAIAAAADNHNRSA